MQITWTALCGTACVDIGVCVTSRDIARVVVLTLSQLRQREVEMKAQYEGCCFGVVYCLLLACMHLRES